MIEHAVVEEMSGEITCLCGWKSGHYALAADANAAWRAHVREQDEPFILPTIKDGPWSVTDPDGTILARFDTEDEAREALLTGDYPDDAQVAFENVTPIYTETLVDSVYENDEPS